jgi:predicted alpha/beta hydrolase family esterase
MKRAIIVHGWETNPKEHWYLKEKNILDNMGIQTYVPEMPNADFPIKEEWMKVIEDFDPDKETVLIGHSLGVPAILRYLESTDKKAGKIFLIAGFCKDLGYEATKNFVDSPFDWAKIKQNAERFYVLNQKEDPYVPLDKGQEIADCLTVELQVVEGDDHFDNMDLNLINKEI